MESKLSHLFGMIQLSESDYQKKIVKNFLTELWYNSILNIIQNKERPDFDRHMYSYAEPSFKIKRSFSCGAAIGQDIVFGATLSWNFDYINEEYTELEVEITSCFLTYLGMSFKATDFISKEDMEKDILNLANGLAVEDWSLKGVPQP